jgi:hypothetical protein
MIQRCQQRGFSTHDSSLIHVSDAALATMGQAKFPSNHTASCDCGESGGRIKPADCERLHVSDGAGKKIASFDVKEFGAQRADDGTIVVFRRPGAPKLTPTQDHQRRIRELNLEHAEFYRRGDL